MADIEFASKHLTMGQMNALVKLLGGEGPVKSILAGDLMAKLEPTPFLTELTTIGVRAMSFSPREFFRPSKHLFRLDAGEFVVGGLVDLPAGSVSVDQGEISYADVTRSTSEVDVVNKLPKAYMFRRPGTFLGRLAALIEGQMEGGEGPLLTNGNGNVFYFRNNEGVVYHASVAWSNELSPAGWVGRVYQPSHFKLTQGTRVFSARNLED